MREYYLDGSFILLDDDRFLINLYVTGDRTKCFYNFNYLEADRSAVSDDYNYFFYKLGFKDNKLITKLNGFLMKKRLKKFMKTYNKFN